MDISLNPQTALFVQHKLASGSYRSVSDLVNEALYLIFEQEK